MKFRAKYPDAKPGDVPELLMEQTDQLFACDCGALTTWRWMTAGLGRPICSDECLSTLKSDIVAEGLQVPDSYQLDPGCTSPGSDCACLKKSLTSDELKAAAAVSPIVDAIVRHRVSYVAQLLSKMTPELAIMGERAEPIEFVPVQLLEPQSHK